MTWLRVWFIAVASSSSGEMREVCQGKKSDNPSVLGDLIPYDLTGKVSISSITESEQVVTNFITCESQKLPSPSDWQLLYDAYDCNGMVFRESDLN
eukprot:189545-Lingulodinium_polyedra.AAC.1